MEQKKNLCAMIPADLHAKVMAEKEQLDLKTLGEYVELILIGFPRRSRRSFFPRWRSTAIRSGARVCRIAALIIWPSSSPDQKCKCEVEMCEQVFSKK